MKRICPNCTTKNLVRQLFSSRPFKSCDRCNKHYQDSIILRLAIGINMLLLLVMANVLNFGNGNFFLLILYLANAYVILQYFPVVKVESPELLMLPPTDVVFEKTNDVSENIRRYKKAQRIAIRDNITKQSSRL